MSYVFEEGVDVLMKVITVKYSICPACGSIGEVYRDDFEECSAECLSCGKDFPVGASESDKLANPEKWNRWGVSFKATIPLDMFLQYCEQGSHGASDE